MRLSFEYHTSDHSGKGSFKHVREPDVSSISAHNLIVAGSLTTLATFAGSEISGVTEGIRAELDTELQDAQILR